MSFYSTLAKNNIKKNGKLYIPFMITCIVSIMMFYMMCFLTGNDGVTKTGGATASSSLYMMLRLGTCVIAIFSVIFLLYTNSFLIKQRTKEFALYTVLGMEKKHVAKIIALENLFTALLSLVIGVSLGIAFSKLMVLFICKLLSFEVPYGFEISFLAIALTVTLFTIIFMFMFLSTIRQVYFSNPIELLRSENTGEKEPKTKWFMAITGVAAIGIGYYIAIATTSIIEAFFLFFVAVILVILGTYFLFTAGSIALLKALKKNKTYYYKTKHFTSVSGMIYRMKQNAVGLANICILSTMVLVMISTTLSLYLGLEDALKALYPKEIEIEFREVTSNITDEVLSLIHETAKQNNIEIVDAIHYKYLFGHMRHNKNNFYEQTKSGDDAFIDFIPLQDYNRLQNTNVTLASDEVLLYAPSQNYVYDTIFFYDKEYTVKEVLTDLHVESGNSYGATMLYVICSDETVITDIINNDPRLTNQSFDIKYAFDTYTDAENQIQFGNDFRKALPDKSDDDFYNVYLLRSREGARTDFTSSYGGLFFLGIFLGILFIIAAILIMYYKQISEGYDDKKRFEIMQKVGMSQQEIKKSIHAQILIVFFLPLIVACIHVAAAFPLVTRLLMMLSMTNTALFAACTLGTILVFTLLYTVVYLLTAKTYYKIVK